MQHLWSEFHMFSKIFRIVHKSSSHTFLARIFVPDWAHVVLLDFHCSNPRLCSNSYFSVSYKKTSNSSLKIAILTKESEKLTLPSQHAFCEKNFIFSFLHLKTPLLTTWHHSNTCVPNVYFTRFFRDVIDLWKRHKQNHIIDV